MGSGKVQVEEPCLCAGGSIFELMFVQAVATVAWDNLRRRMCLQLLPSCTGQIDRCCHSPRIEPVNSYNRGDEDDEEDGND